MKLDLLVIDLGNSRVKWAAASATVPIGISWEYPTAKITLKWIYALAKKYSWHQVVLASVVPKWNAELEKAFGPRMTVLSGKLQIRGVEFAYPKPAELGADRIAVAVAAQAEGLFPAIIVACGTATAFTVLDAKGRLCGGAIAPGLQAQLNALLGSTAQLPLTTLRKPSSALAKSTRDAIRAGVLLNFQGGLKEIVARLVEALPRGTKPHIILTGGHAKLAAKSLRGPHSLRPLLVLEGLRIIGERLGEPPSE